MGDFELTDDMANANALASTIIAGVSLAMCLAVVIAAAWIYTIERARTALDRISFRLMLYTMIFEVGYDICYVLTYPELHAVDPSAVSCQVVIYFQVATLATVNYLCTCIAINLMLLIVFGVDPVRRHLEHWYVSVSICLGFGITVVPAALGHFGSDPLYASCYFTNTDPTIRLLRFGLDIYLWQGLATIIATGAVIVTLVTLFLQGQATAKALFRGQILDLREDRENRTRGNTSSRSRSHDEGRTCSHRLLRLFKRRKGTELHQLQDKFLVIAVKIALYPISLIIVNTVLTVGDMYLSYSGGVSSRSEYGLYVIYYNLYGGRGFFFAALGILVDPCLRRGSKIAWRDTRRRWNIKKYQDKSTFSSSSPEVINGAVHSQPQNGDLNFMTALASIEYDEAMCSRGVGAARNSSGEDRGDLTRSFTGVRLDMLPPGMSDEVGVETKVEMAGSALRIETMDGRRVGDLERNGEARKAERLEAEMRFERVLSRL